MQGEAVRTPAPCLVLYGNSIFLAGIKAELERAAMLELLTIESGRQDALELICKRQPRAVLFDLGTGQLDDVVSLLREQPGLLLIGVDPSSNEMLVLSSQPARAVTIDDLLNVIKEGDLKKSFDQPSSHDATRRSNNPTSKERE